MTINSALAQAKATRETISRAEPRSWVESADRVSCLVSRFMADRLWWEGVPHVWLR
jgi:hypothetical protein